MKYKVGDRVLILDVPDSEYREISASIPSEERVKKEMIGKVWEIKEVYDRCCKIFSQDGNYWSFPHCALKLINNNNNIMTNLTSKLKLLTKGEPAKTFIKTGITNEQDILTPEGTELFLNWLFEKNKADFAKEVATPLLEEEGKE